MGTPYVKHELSFEEYQNLVERFNSLVKTKDFKPLYYKDYRKITGKHLNGVVSKVIIEFVDDSHFIIAFYPTEETIYVGNIFDLSFGTFIKDHFKEMSKETMEKNNTYDIWGNGINNTANSISNITNSISSQETLSYLNYSETNQISVNSDSNDVFTSKIETKPWGVGENPISRIDKLEEKVGINEVKTKEDIDYIQHQLNILSERIADSEYSLRKVQQVYGVLGDRVSKLEDENEQEKHKKCSVRKDNEIIMNTNKMFNFDFGFVDSNIRMSPYGMAVRNADGRYVSYDVKTGSVIDVEPFNFEGHRLMMKMPVAIKDIAVGDIVIHNHKPMFVVSTGDKITAIDIYNGEEKTILPTVNMFNFNYITKVFSLFNFTGNNTPTAENPFGNIIPFMLMGNENMDMKDFFTMMAIANGGNMSTMFQNPMMMYMMFNSTTEMKEMLPFIMMSGAFNQAPVNNNCNNNNNGQN